EPLPLVVTINGDALLCNGDADGNVTGTISGGTAPYIITLNETGATLNVATDGGSYDFSGLSAAISGGFDQYTVTVTDANGNSNGCTATVGPVDMIEPDTLNLSMTPSIYAGGWNVTGCVNDGTIDLTVSGGVAGYTYDWDIDGTGDFDDTEDLSNLLPGWYNIQVEDANGCLIDDSIFLTAPAALNSTTIVTTDYNGQDVSCQGASDGGISVTAINGTPAYTYEWADAQGNVISTSASVNGVSAGWYYVTATDQNYCTAYDSIEVIDAPPLTSNIIISSNYNGQNISCFGASDGSIDFTVNGGTPSYTFQWTDDQGNVVGTSEDLIGIPAGTYSVTMNDLNGCLVDTSITLTEPPFLTAVTSVTSDYNGQDISCFGLSDGGIDVSANGGTPALSYEWTDDQGNVVSTSSVVNGIPEGLYTVAVTDVNGCQVVEDIYVSQPPALNLNIDILTDYFGLPVSCVSQQDGEIQAVVTGGTPGYTYVWDTNPNQFTPTIIDLGIGTYNVVVTDTNGCQISQSVTLDAHPIPIINPDLAMEVCQGETVTFSSNSAPTESCEWEFSNGMILNDCGPNTLYIDEVGCYDAQLTVTNQWGCVDSAFMTDYICIRPNPVAAFYASNEIVSVLETDVEFINESTGAIDYLWDFGDGSTATTVDAYHQYSLDQPNEYDVTLYAYNEYGCEDTAMLQIEVRDVLLFYVPNTFTPDGDEFNNVFVPVIGSGVSSENYHFIIFNRWGEIVFESYDPAFGWDGTYNGRLAQDGTYTWKLTLTASQNVIESGERREHIGHVNLIR
ncbi:MAG: gliding motility-associated C-terminal domain-containing protein, partial [bacterium]|nr:gliding motility-associated C-terminal domain-containing protein [bacterium]